MESLPLDSANTLGTGPVRIALILPLTQGSGPSVVGQSLRNAAELAITESGGGDDYPGSLRIGSGPLDAGGSGGRDRSVSEF